MFAQVNDLRLAYGDRGREHERALLLVHGFPLDRRLWAAQAGAFGTIDPGHHAGFAGSRQVSRSSLARSPWISTPMIWPHCWIT